MATGNFKDSACDTAHKFTFSELISSLFFSLSNFRSHFFVCILNATGVVPAEKLAESHSVHPSLLVCLLVFPFPRCILKPIIKTNLLNAFVEREHSRHGVDFFVKINKRSKICT